LRLARTKIPLFLWVPASAKHGSLAAPRWHQWGAPRGSHFEAAGASAARAVATCLPLIAQLFVGIFNKGQELPFAGAAPVPALAGSCIHRGSPARAAPRGAVDHDAGPSAELPADRSSRTVPRLRQTTHKTSLVAQQDKGLYLGANVECRQ
jgi:hypothetical protein